jgi:hypothetical protein
MNICETEIPITILAKTGGREEKKSRKVTYNFIDEYHSLCLDKKEIILAQLCACYSGKRQEHHRNRDIRIKNGDRSNELILPIFVKHIHQLVN